MQTSTLLFLGWTLTWYALGLVPSLFLGEAALYYWPHMFMFLLGVNSKLGFAGSILTGGVVASMLAFLAGRLTRFRGIRGLGAAAVGLACALLAIALLTFAAWNIAEAFDWPTAV